MAGAEVYALHSCRNQQSSKYAAVPVIKPPKKTARGKKPAAKKAG
jgi:hypothetical protein